MADQKLTAKESRFVKEYLIDLNATQAAIRAKYSKNSANEIASQNLAKLHIRQAIQKAMDERAVKLNVTSEKVLAELSRLATWNMGSFCKRDENGAVIVDDKGMPSVDFTLMTTDDWAAVQEITQDTTGGSGDGERKVILRTKIKMADKGLNLERLGRNLKLFTDKIEVGADNSLAAAIAAARKRAKK